MESLGVTSEEELSDQLQGEIWPIGGGKGGVGKSIVAISLAYWLGRLRKQVILLDADLGGANLHTMLGMRIPAATLEDFLLRRVETLEAALLPTALENVRLLAGGADVPALANPSYAQKGRLIRAMNGLAADYIIVDLGAGSSLNTLDFFLASPRKIIVMTPQPTSVQNAYGFVKAALYRDLGRALRRTALKGYLDNPKADESKAPPQSTEEILQEISVRAPEALEQARSAVDGLRISIIINQIRSPKESKVGSVIAEVCRRFLKVPVHVLGAIPFDPALDRWARTMERDSASQITQGEALRAAYEIAYKILHDPAQRPGRLIVRSGGEPSPHCSAWRP
jgi:flagellar biosynthesis protein FlhG